MKEQQPPNINDQIKEVLTTSPIPLTAKEISNLLDEFYTTKQSATSVANRLRHIKDIEKEGVFYSWMPREKTAQTQHKDKIL